MAITGINGLQVTGQTSTAISMSDAQVQFHRIEGDRHWARDREPITSGQEQSFSFACPKYGRRCGDLIIVGRTAVKRDNSRKDGVPQWEWDGNAVSPTFTPSVNCQGCWHGFIRKGRCVDVAGQEEPQL